MRRLVVNEGDRYDKYKIIEELPTLKKGRQRRRRFLCECDCGVRKAVSLGDLTSGSTKSCGCFSRELASKRLGSDLRGYKSGRLTVISHNQVKNNVNFWLCKCICGNRVVASSDRLKSGRIKSCGCIRLKNTVHGTVYGIYDRDGFCVYIGSTTTTLKLRLKHHKSHSNTLISKWIRSLDYIPEIKSLETGIPYESLKYVEAHRIKSFKGSGLLNKHHNNKVILNEWKG